MILIRGYSDVHVLNTLEFVGVRNTYWILEYFWIFGLSRSVSAKMTKRDDLGLKTLFCTNSCILLKTVKNWFPQCENEKTCWSWVENVVLYKLVHFAENNQFSAPEQHVLSFSHWAHWANHFLAIPSKVHGFVQNSVFSPTSEGFAIFAVCAPLFGDFQQSVRVFAN